MAFGGLRCADPPYGDLPDTPLTIPLPPRVFLAGWGGVEVPASAGPRARRPAEAGTPTQEARARNTLRRNALDDRPSSLRTVSVGGFGDFSRISTASSCHPT